MGKLVDPHLCPECRGNLTGDASCPNCGLQLVGPLANELWATMQHADQLVTRLRQSNRPVPAYPAPHPATPIPTPAVPAAVPPIAATGSSTATAPVGPQLARTPSPISIPVILLALGGLCILIAALVFVAVAWGSLGIGGRTAILAGITMVMGAGAILLTVKDLRWAAETFWVIVVGMVTLDILGARSAGLFGDDHERSYQIAAPLMIVVMLVLALAVGSWSARAATGQIISIQISALIGIGIGNGLGFVGFDPFGLIPAVLIPLFAGVAIWSRQRVRVFAWGLAGLALGNWMILFGYGMAKALQDQQHWWSSLDWWPLALAGGYAISATVPRLPYAVRVVAAGMSLLAWSVVVLGPDHATSTQRSIWATGMILFLSLLVLLGGRVWGRAAGIAGILWSLPTGAKLLVNAVSLSDVGLSSAVHTWNAPVQAYLDTAWWAQILLAISIALLLLSLGRLFPEHTRRTALTAVIPAAYLVIALALISAAATLGLPLWAFAGIVTTLLLGAILLTWPSGGEVAGLVPSVVSICVLGLFTLFTTGPSNAVSAGAAVLVLSTVTVYWYAASRAGRRTETILTLIGIPLLGFWTWVEIWAALDQSVDLGLALAAGYGSLVLLVAPLAQRVSKHKTDRIVTELMGAIFIPIPALAFGSDHHALALSLAGAGLALSSVCNADRELLGWVSVPPLLAGAMVYDFKDFPVAEVWSLPISMVLIAVGILRMGRDHELGSYRALGAGTLLALAPSLILALIDPLSWRGAILFAAGVLVLLAGAFRHLGMPFYSGALITAVMAIRYLGPWAQGIPRWVGIGIVGLLLLGLGISWEFGRKNLKTAAGYLKALR